MIIPAYSSQLDLTTLSLDESVNGGKPIRYLVSAPTMRIPLNVSERKVTPINSILCSGLGTAVGCMPYDKAAIQVSQGYFRTLSG